MTVDAKTSELFRCGSRHQVSVAALSPESTGNFVLGWLLSFAVTVAAVSAFSCGSQAPSGLIDAGADGASQWARAEELWERRAPEAHAAFLAIDSRVPEGSVARNRLARADLHYREGIRRLATGEPHARESLLQGVELGPMDPELYLPLARACRTRGLARRAEDYYRKFLRLRPTSPLAHAARRELASLDPELSGIFDPRPDPRPTPAAAVQSRGARLAALVTVMGGAALLVTALLLFWRGRPGRALAELAAQSPELHPSIAYLVGSLRHEMLKHRIGAVGDAVSALASGEATPEQRAFLCARLYGGAPLAATWRGHVRTFERALAPRLDLRKDPGFRRATAAIETIASLEPAISGGRERARVLLRAAHAELGRFDAELSELVGRLVRTPVDRSLLAEVVAEVRGEYAPGSVQLDELAIGEIPGGLAVEVFRFDLVLVLKNIVRNAVLAVGRAPPPRRVALGVEVDIEPTGHEIVRLRVQDTSDEPLTTEAIYERRVDRGLGLVTAALARYDGAIEVEPGTGGFAKAVTVRFFRAFDGVQAQS